jgi:hypothetical protein
MAAAARDAFVHAFQIGSVVTGSIAVFGAIVALVLLPARARDDQPAAIDTGDELDLPEMESIAERSA